jgi:ketopantoate reductase
MRRYGQIAQDAGAKWLLEQIVDEVLAVARDAGVVLPELTIASLE